LLVFFLIKFKYIKQDNYIIFLPGKTRSRQIRTWRGKIKEIIF